MTTEKQTIANCLNALKGGVKTAEGKNAVRLNAVSHGLLSNEALVPGEDGCRLAELQARCRAELQPVGELETILVERIISSTWRLKRAVKVERLCKGRRRDYFNDAWDTHIRYETAIERQIYKALHELERLQKARLALVIPASELESTRVLGTPPSE
jgi:hypothetical protein